MLSKLLKSNFKNDLSHMITFFLIIVLSVVMLHTGLAVLLGYNGLHAELRDKYNFADLAVVSELSDDDKFKMEDIISSADYIESFEYLEPLSLPFTVGKEGADADSKDLYDTKTNDYYVLPYGEWGDIEAPHFVEKMDEECENPIYISLYYNANVIKKKVGDKVDIQVGEDYYTFQIAGIYENILGNSNLGIIYVEPSLFNEWKNRDEEKRKDSEESFDRRITFIKVTDDVTASEASGMLTKSFSEHEILSYAVDSDMEITMLTYMQNIIAAVLSAFAIVITIIAMIIIYFRISNSIEQSIVDIGALKALGYTSRQIRMAMVLEFAITTLLAIAVGVIGSYVALVPFEEGIRNSSGVVWDRAFEPLALIATLILILGTVVIVAVASTKKISKLDPVIVLRFGIDDHSFKKNRAPIERTPGPLSWIMAVKSVLTSAKQNILLFVIMSSIGVVVTLSIFMTYNAVYDSMHLLRMVSTVSDDVSFIVKDKPEAIAEIRELPEVDCIWYMDTREFTVEGYSAYAYITEDWNDVPEGNVNIYEGIFPRYDNEIALAGTLSKNLGVSVGDEVKVANGSIEKKYLITGLLSGAGSGGMDLLMTAEGAGHLGSKLGKQNISTTVKNHSWKNSLKLVDDVESMYGDKMVAYANVIDTLKSGDNAVVMIASMLVAVLIIVSLLVIILSMNLLVKTVIIKRQREIGIKKALGFSSTQLRFELVLSMMPFILLGAVVGGIVGCLESNNIMAALLGSIGIMNSSMDVYSWMGFGSVIFIAIVSFLIIWFISGRIKRISAYSLITE